ncbi:MAG TPA: hypothetical protein ENI87_12375 [bacterium]|nr:hypothetical protein [bacterium]
MRTLPLSSAALALVAVSACSIFSGRPDPRWAGYREWTPVIRGLTGDPDEQLDDAHEAAAGYRNVFVNDVGRETMLGDGPYVYPVGTVIVKEQFPDEASWRADTDPTLTVMLKVSAGEGEETWHWATGWNGAAPNRFCANCHDHVEEDDFVFTNGSVLGS